MKKLPKPKQQKLPENIKALYREAFRAQNEEKRLKIRKAHKASKLDRIQAHTVSGGAGPGTGKRRWLSRTENSVGSILDGSSEKNCPTIRSVRPPVAVPPLARAALQRAGSGLDVALRRKEDLWMDDDGVQTAFDLILEEIGSVSKELKEEAKRLVDKGLFRISFNEDLQYISVSCVRL
jgi:hypothetical protein